MEDDLIKRYRPDVELSQEGEQVLKLMESSNSNIFLTGRAGTGKSTILRYFRSTTKKNIVVLAPTGVAAVNVQGQTIHSFFKFGIGITVDDIKKKWGKTYKNLDTIVIDEISMVRADLLDCIDKFMRLNGKDPDRPFGGVQVIAIGDLYQLPPVVSRGEWFYFDGVYTSPYFFDSHCFEQADFLMVELLEVHRQSDTGFIDILDNVRTGRAGITHLETLNSRHGLESEDDLSIFLVPTNYMADQINSDRLEKLPGEEEKYKGFVSGSFNEKDLPTKKELVLKEGAQVMLLNNDQKKRWVNGDIGKVISFGRGFIEVEMEDGRVEEVEKYSWEKVAFIYDEDEGRIKTETAGNFTQFPIKLAWAVTIHKGQGKTYEKVIIDFGSGTFAPGQAYVALSRCRSLEGLLMKSPMYKKHMIVDPRVKDFMDSYPRVRLEDMIDD